MLPIKNFLILAVYIFTVMTMIFGYGVMFLSSAFLDTTPHTNAKSTEVDHGASKVWEGMPKDEYQKIKIAEEQTMIMNGINQLKMNMNIKRTLA
ncbi:hypothetical protein ACFVSS_16490 [Peribacillus butanolivorans]|uniref:hypothetical protein n=1 Tax=Peribacillus butanolivorans TaxID=421767 RepID=UPI0036DF1794